ncbi:protein translocase subunit SecD [Aquipuribacter hungaricus]|uniref:Protein translocase subunit SecD n=2 Tax=Aquipuribacter hungaricus TaxID=545624 RepID=A0ABV7WDK2_9MICO
MTPTSRRSRPGRTLTVLAVLVAIIFGTVAGGYLLDDARWTPGLALDLEGGTQIILSAQAEEGQTVPAESMVQAVDVIRQRVNGTGVTEAEVSRQGSDNIVVSIPGQADEETLDLVRASAQLEMRPVLLTGSGIDPSLLQPTAEPSAGASGAAVPPSGAPVPPLAPTTAPTVAPTGDATVAPAVPGAGPVAPSAPATDGRAAPRVDLSALRPAGAAPSAPADPAAVPTDAAVPPAAPTIVPTDAAVPTGAAVPTDAAVPSGAPVPSGAAEPAVEPTDGSDLAQLTPDVLAEFEALVCVDPADPTTVTRVEQGEPDRPLVVCSVDGFEKYVLGPVEVEGERIADAQWGFGQSQTGVSNGQPVVNLEFDGQGTREFTDISRRLFGLTGDQNRFGIVLDGLVISAPTMNGIIADGRPQISGNFTQDSAESLANQLKFGALPLSFTVESTDSVSATLGTEQLRIGLIAGLVGLLLVVGYSLLQYRALGLVTVASLLVVGVITYGVLLLLSWRQGYRLSLPGVAGLIVAIGITADSFIIYFERVRDEIRDGRSLEVAVERGWERARRTILASDAVSFLAAVVLYLLAVGGVRGFAFTLGVTTVIDLIIVFLFTKPLVTLLARTRFFADGHRLSGFDPEHLGSVVARRAVRSGSVPGRTAAATGTGTGTTLAERKRAAARADEGAVL